MTIPTWEDCVAAGMTAAEASRARNVGSSAASRWSKKTGIKFRKGHCGGSRLKGLPSWTDLHAQGLTAEAAAKQRGAKVGAAYTAASKGNFSWAPQPPRKSTPEERAERAAARARSDEAAALRRKVRKLQSQLSQVRKDAESIPCTPMTMADFAAIENSRMNAATR